MKKKLDQVFKNKNKRVLNMYCTAGFPNLESTGSVMHALQNAGADIIEVGIPYSDPIADGPVIQDSNNIALANGITLQRIFLQLEQLKDEIHVPIILMGYLNPVMQFGFENFCEEAARVGVSGIILPDLPMKEFDEHYAKILAHHKLQLIFLVTPATSEQRIKAFDKRTGGFLYAVSSAGTTGDKESLPKSKVENVYETNLKEEEDEVILAKKKTGKSPEVLSEQDKYFSRLQKMNLKHPVLIGFGISDKKSFDHACDYAAGAIIGSAYIKALKSGDDIEQVTSDFVKNIVQ